MTILSESLLTLVCGHLMAFLLFSVWHNAVLLVYEYNIIVPLLFALHAVDEALGRLEAGEIVSGNGNSGVL